MVNFYFKVQYEQILKLPYMMFSLLKYGTLLRFNSKLKNKHKGAKIIIISGGPSVNALNLEDFKNENLLVINSFYMHPKARILLSGQGYKYYLAAPLHPPHTKKRWNNYLESILSCTYETSTDLIFGINEYKDSFLSFPHLDLIPHHKKFFFCPAAPRYIEFAYGNLLCNLNPCFPIISAGSASVYALLYACYMGFSEIYLLGVDHSHIYDRMHSKEDHFYSTHNMHNSTSIEKPPLNSIAMFKQANTINQYNYISQIYSTSKIFNSSQTSIVDIFDYKLPSNDFSALH